MLWWINYFNIIVLLKGSKSLTYLEKCLFLIKLTLRFVIFCSYISLISKIYYCVHIILSYNMFIPFSYAVNINWRDLVRIKYNISIHTRYINILTLLIVDWQLHILVMYSVQISPWPAATAKQNINNYIFLVC